MFNAYCQLIESQYSAALRTLRKCIEACPEDDWQTPICNLTFAQAGFHAVFWTDLYLGPNIEAVKTQPFHAQNSSIFEGYEELEDREQTNHYDREFLDEYLTHCERKSEAVLRNATQEALESPSGFPWIEGPVAEVHVYNIRHLQHHAAQMSLRLRLDHEIGIPWLRGGFDKR